MHKYALNNLIITTTNFTLTSSCLLKITNRKQKQIIDDNDKTFQCKKLKTKYLKKPKQNILTCLF